MNEDSTHPLPSLEPVYSNIDNENEIELGIAVTLRKLLFQLNFSSIFLKIPILLVTAPKKRINRKKFHSNEAIYDQVVTKNQGFRTFVHSESSSSLSSMSDIGQAILNMELYAKMPSDSYE